MVLSVICSFAHAADPVPTPGVSTAGDTKTYLACASTCIDPTLGRCAAQVRLTTRGHHPVRCQSEDSPSDATCNQTDSTQTALFRLSGCGGMHNVFVRFIKSDGFDEPHVEGDAPLREYRLWKTFRKAFSQPTLKSVRILGETRNAGSFVLQVNDQYYRPKNFEKNAEHARLIFDLNLTATSIKRLRLLQRKGDFKITRIKFE
jgi:hypothetical protein